MATTTTTVESFSAGLGVASSAGNRRVAGVSEALPALDITPATRPIDSDADSNIADAGTTDSGYGSALGTPEKTPESSQDRLARDGLHLPRKMFQRKTIKLKPFDQDIPKSTLNRFSDLLELFDQPLYQHLAKKSPKFRAISIKLKVLGPDEDEAKPWIVVMCDKNVLKYVEQFFNWQSVKSQYHSHDSDFPSFDIVFFDRPPRQDAAETVYGLASMDFSLTWCGIPIKVISGDVTRYATVGGLVGVKDSDGSLQFYGMTVSHIFKQNDIDHVDLNEIDEDEDEDEGENEDFDEDDFNENEDEKDHFELDISFEDLEKQLNPQVVPDTKAWTEIGSVFTASGIDQRNLDWALISMGRVLPNYFLNLKDFGRDEVSSNVAQVTSRSDSIRAVYVGAKHGKLSMAPSMLLQRPSQGFVMTLNLSLSEGEVIHPGDCGSWVIDSLTREVYGHVVASDAFGESYVIPLASSFIQIKAQLMAQDVFLPSVGFLMNRDRTFGKNTRVHETPSHIFRNFDPIHFPGNIRQTNSNDSDYASATLPSEVQLWDSDRDSEGDQTPLGDESYPTNRIQLFNASNLAIWEYSTKIPDGSYLPPRLSEAPQVRRHFNDSAYGSQSSSQRSSPGSLPLPIRLSPGGSRK